MLCRDLLPVLPRQRFLSDNLFIFRLSLCGLRITPRELPRIPSNQCRRAVPRGSRPAEAFLRGLLRLIRCPRFRKSLPLCRDGGLFIGIVPGAVHRRQRGPGRRELCLRRTVRRLRQLFPFPELCPAAVRVLQLFLKPGKFFRVLPEFSLFPVENGAVRRKAHCQGFQQGNCLLKKHRKLLSPGLTGHRKIHARRKPGCRLTARAAARRELVRTRKRSDP